MTTVYDDSNQWVYYGTAEDAHAWIMAQAYTLRNGGKLFRTWEENGYIYIDVGPVYHYKKD